MGSIERVDRPKPWRAVYRGPDRRKHSKSFARKIDAERWLKVSEAEALTGQWVDPTAGAKLFGPYAEEWVAYKRSAVGETTATNIESLLRARVLPEFEAKQLKQITTPDVRRWLAAMTEEGLSASTVHTNRKVLTEVLDQAVDDGLIASNAAKKAKAPSPRPRRQLFLTASELRELADECGPYAPLVWFLGWSGLRFGEATALRVGRVDPARRRVRVEEGATEVGGRLVFDLPKTYEARVCALPAAGWVQLDSSSSPTLPTWSPSPPASLVFWQPNPAGSAPRARPMVASLLRYSSGWPCPGRGLPISRRSSDASAPSTTAPAATSEANKRSCLQASTSAFAPSSKPTSPAASPRPNRCSSQNCLTSVMGKG